LSIPSFAQNKTSQFEVEIDFPEFFVSKSVYKVPLRLSPKSDTTQSFPKQAIVYINNKPVEVSLDLYGKGNFEVAFSEKTEVNIVCGDYFLSQKVNPIPLWFSVFPSLIAILFALIFKEVILSILLGLLVGSCVISFHVEASILSVVGGFLNVLTHYIIDALASKEHISIIVFSLLIGGMVGVITSNGGMRGVVVKLSRYANDSRSGQLVTWFLGILIFFDDYANTLVVGNTMRPVTDQLKVSREKLAYIVDSTAAPISAIAFITTWIGAELGYIGDGLSKISLEATPYSVFISSLAYSFYPILAILFVPILIWSGREFGPMLKAEQNARNAEPVKEEKVEQMDLSKLRWYNGIVPIVVLILTVMVGIAVTGAENTFEKLSDNGYSGGSSLSEVWQASASINNFGFLKNIGEFVGNADSYTALLWASFLSLVVAVAMTLFQKIMNIEKTIEATIDGFKGMLHALIILTLAWSLAEIMDNLRTVDFITTLVSGNLSPYLLPSLVFVLAALVSFSTGSSWGTMAILFPLVIPITWAMTYDSGWSEQDSLPLFYNAISCVLAGSVFGDHCSPISDTSIISSLASSCNHIQHVRTQIPYALSVAGVSLIVGTLATSIGVPAWLSMLFSIGVLVLIIRIFGKKVEVYSLK
jgi:Na+/H+ antiporter NhaC